MAIDPDLIGRIPPPVERDPIHPRSGLRDTLRRITAPIGGLGLLLLKFLSQAKVLLLLGVKGKYLLTAGTMLVSVGAYTLLSRWRFAAIFVGLLFVHEMGHAIALRREGIPTSPVLFVPFLGAVIGMRGRPRNAWIEAKVGLAGPLLGSAGALGVLLLGYAYNSQLLEAAAFTGFFLNLFNLLPMVPLDGGRAAAALHPLAWIAGIAGLAGLAIWHPNPILFLFLVIGGMEAWTRLRVYVGRAADGRVLRGDARPARDRRRHVPRAGRRARRGHGPLARAGVGRLRCWRAAAPARARRPSAAWRPCPRRTRCPRGCSASGRRSVLDARGRGDRLRHLEVEALLAERLLDDLARRDVRIGDVALLRVRVVRRLAQVSTLVRPTGAERSRTVSVVSVYEVCTMIRASCRS